MKWALSTTHYNSFDEFSKIFKKKLWHTRVLLDADLQYSTKDTTSQSYVTKKIRINFFSTTLSSCTFQKKKKVVFDIRVNSHF